MDLPSPPPTPPLPPPSPPPPSLPSSVQGGEEGEEEGRGEVERRDKNNIKEERREGKCSYVCTRRLVGAGTTGVVLSLHHVLTVACLAYLSTCSSHLSRHLGLRSNHLSVLPYLSYVGPLLTGIVVGYVGGKGDKVRWVGAGMLAASVGVGVTALTALYPQTLHAHTQYAPSFQDSAQGPYYCNVEMLRSLATTTTTTTLRSINNNSSVAKTLHPMATFLHANPRAILDCEDSDPLLLLIWVLASIVTGAGVSIGYTLGLPYLDDGVSRKATPLYIAVIVSVGAFGHLLGVYLASLSLSVYVYPFNNPGYMTPDDSDWVGGWWMGQAVLSVFMFTTATLLLLMPRKLGKAGKQSPGHQRSKSTVDRTNPGSDSNHNQAPSNNNINNNNNIHQGRPQYRDFEVDEYEVDEEERERRRRRYGVVEFDLDGMRDIEIGYAADERDSGYSMEEMEGEEERRRREELREERKTDGEEEESEVVREILRKRCITCYEITSGVRDIFETVVRLLSQRVLLFSTLSDVCVALALSCSTVWLPTFLQHRFRTAGQQSPFYTSVCSTSTVIMGVGVGGVWVSRCGGVGGRAVAGVACGCLALQALLTTMLALVSCGFDSDLPGVMAPDMRSLELHRGCSIGCGCPSLSPHPVCVRDGPITLSFYSPCHAGCPPPIVPPGPGILPIFTNCTCASPSAEVTAGHCSQETCPAALLYTTLFCLAHSLTTITIITSVIITLRCVNSEDQSAALGVKVTMSSLVSLLGPPLLRPLMDSSCLAWSHLCGLPDTCGVYDTDDLAYKLHGSTGAILALASLFAALMAHSASDVQILDALPHILPTFSIFDPNSSPGLRSSFRKLSRLATGRRSSGKWRVPPMSLEHGEGRRRRSTVVEQHKEGRVDLERMEERTEEVGGEADRETQPPPRVHIIPISLMKTTGV